MAWGGGVFTRTYGSTAWQTDASNSVGIVADRHDTNDQDLADGINACINKAGGNAPTADLPMGGFKHTNLAAGTAAAPTFCAGNDQDTGMYSGGANTLNFATNGTQRFSIDSSGNSLFSGILSLAATGGEGGELRIRNSANADNFILDSGPGDVIRYLNSNNTAQIWENNSVEVMRLTAAGNLGVGTNNPPTKVTISGTSTSGAPADADSKANVLRLATPGGSNGNGGQLEFGAGLGTFTQSYHAAIKSLLQDGAGNTTGDLAFYTRNATSDTSLTERVRIASGGNVGIGTNNPTASLHVGGAASKNIRVDSSQNSFFWGVVNNTMGLSVNRNVATGAFTDTGKAHAEIDISASSGDGNITFLTTTSNNTLATERMRIAAGGNVGIGTTSPTTRLHVSAAGFDGAKATFESTNSGNSIEVKGVNGAGINDSAYLVLSDGSNTCWVGLTGTNATAGALRFATASSERMRITAAGEVLVGSTTDNGAYNLQCNGTGVWGAGAYVNGSDERIKEEIEPLADSLNIINQLNPVTFKYKEDWSKDRNTQAGFIAQEVDSVLSEEIYKDGIVQQGNEYFGLAYQSFIPLLVKAIQELSAKLDDLTDRVTALEA